MYRGCEEIGSIDFDIRFSLDNHLVIYNSKLKSQKFVSCATNQGQFASENQEDDFKKIINFFATIEGANPELGLGHLQVKS